MLRSKKEPKFGEIAISLGFITKEDLDKALEIQSAGELWGVGYILMRLGALNLEQIEEVLSYQDISFVNVDEEIEPEDYEHQRIGEIAVSSKAIKYSDLLHALEQKSRMKELDGTEPKLGKVLVDLNLITEDQLKSLLVKGGINVYQCQRCSRIYNVKRFSTREFCCPFCHYRDQTRYESDVLNIEGRLQVGNFGATQSKLRETQKILLEQSLGKIGHYEVLEEIGIGRMGVVSKVREEKTGKLYALKAFIVDNEFKETSVNYFEHHFVKYQQLSHGNIAKVLEFDKFENLLYAVFEYTDGIPLDLWLLREGADTRRKIEILTEVAKTLAYAHDNNVYHLNLHPGNIFIDKNGKIKITDFAIPAPLIDTSIDEPVYGMRKYLAPENFKQDVGSLEAKTDQFAFGCIAYEVLSSQPPFTGATLSDISRQLEKEMPPAIESKYTLPYKDFENVIFKCLENRISSRYSNMYEVVDDSNAALKGDKTIASPISSGRRIYQKYGTFLKIASLPVIAIAVFFAIQLIFAKTEEKKPESDTRVFVDEQYEMILAAKQAYDNDDFKRVRAIIDQMEDDTKKDLEVQSLELKLAENDEDFEKILATYKRRKDLVENAGNALIIENAAKKLSSYKLAQDVLLASYEFNKNEPVIYPELMEMLRKSKRWEKLLEVSEYAVTTLNEKEDCFAYACLASGKLKQWNKSQTYFMQALSSSANKALAYHFRAKINFDRLGSNDKQNLRILDTVNRDAIKAQSLDSRISGNAYFIKKVNQEVLRIKLRILLGGRNPKALNDNNLKIDTADMLAQIGEFNTAQELLGSAKYENVTGKKLQTAAATYYLCQNFDAVIRLLSIAEKKQNFVLSDYLLMTRALIAKEKFIQAYSYCKLGLVKYPDNYPLLFEFARVNIAISREKTPDSIIDKFRTNSLYLSKYKYLQSLLFRTKNHFMSEREALTEILQVANSMSEPEIYDSSILKLMNMMIHSPRRLSLNRLMNFIDYLRYSQNAGLMHTKIMKELLRSGYNDIAQSFHEAAKLEVDGIQEFGTEIELLTNIYTFKHANILADLANNKDLRGFVVDIEDLNLVAELSDRQDVKDAVFNLVKRDTEESWVRKNNVLGFLRTFVEKSGKTTEQIATLASYTSEESIQIGDLLTVKFLPSDYFTFIKSWGAENLVPKLTDLLQNGKVFESFNYLEKYKAKNPKEELIGLILGVNNILGFSDETYQRLLLYKETYLKNPPGTTVEYAIQFALREQNEKQFESILQRFKDQISKDKIEWYRLLNDFITQKDYRKIFFDKLNYEIASKLDESNLATSRFLKLFVMLSMKYGFFNELKPKLMNLAGGVEGLDSEFIYFIQTIENGLLQKGASNASVMKFDPNQSRNEILISAVQARLNGDEVISDYLLNHLPSTTLIDKTALYFNMLYDEAAVKLNPNECSGTIRKIVAFLQFVEEAEDDVLTLADFSESFDKILTLIKADKFIGQGSEELAVAALNSIENSDSLEDIINFLRKKIYFSKGEFNLAAQLSVKQEYAGIKNIQLLSELQSDDARLFANGVERLVSDTSIDSELLFDAASVLYSSSFKLDIAQINSIFKHNRIEMSNDPKLRLAQAILFKSIDRGRAADSIIEELMKFHPQNPVIYLIAARLSILSNDFDQATEIIEKAKENEALSTELNQLEVLMLILNEKYAGALDKTLALLSSAKDYDKDTIVKYLQYLSSKLPPASQKLIFEKIYSIDPEDVVTNELVLINAFMLNDVKEVKEVAERLYQSAIEKTKYAKWIIWAQCRREEHADAFALANLYSTKNDPWINGAKEYCELAMSDFEPENIEKTRSYLSSISQEVGYAEQILWGSLIAEKIGDSQLAQRLKTEGADFMPENLSASYNLIVDRIRSGRYRDAETLIKQGDQRLANWQPFNLAKLMIAGKTNVPIDRIVGFREIIRNSSSTRIFEMTFWLTQELIDQDAISESDIDWLNDMVDSTKLTMISESPETKAEILAMQGIIEFQNGRYRKAQQFWAQASENSAKYAYLKSYTGAIDQAHSVVN